MLKKRVKKLTLGRETLCSLEESRLAPAMGGTVHTIPVTEACTVGCQSRPFVCIPPTEFASCFCPEA